MAVWAALPLLVLGGAGLSVDSLSPDALCPPLEETRRAVASRLGNVELDGTWHATYVLVHRAQGDFVTLRVLDPQGVQRLERELPAQGHACASLPAVIALVLERFFAQLEQAAPAAEPAPPSAAEPDADPPATVAVVPPPAPASPAAPPPNAPARPVESGLQPVAPALPPEHAFRLGAELWGTPEWLAPGLRLERRVGGAFRLTFRAGYDLSRERVAAFQGVVSLQRMPVSLLANADLLSGRTARLTAGLELLGVVEWAQASELAHAAGATRVVPGAGARLGAHFFESSLLQPFFELTAAWLVRQWAPAFQVGPREVLAPPGLVLGGALGVDAGFF